MKSLRENPFFLLSHMEDDQIELAFGALLIAKDAYPKLNIQHYLDRLDQMATEVRAKLDGASDISQQIAVLNHYLFKEQGFTGNREDYNNPRNSYLNDVLDRKLGIPITLSIVYIELGKRIDLPIVGIGFPGHFLVKHKAKSLEIFIDPFEKGQILSKEDLTAKLEALFNQPVPLRPEFLREATNKQILSRVLRNLKQIYFKQNDYEKAIKVGERITWLEPHSPLDYRDLGYLYYQMNAYGKSLAAFQEYLQLEENPADQAEIEKNVQILAKRLAITN